MKKPYTFFRNLFMATGIVWFVSAVAILVFQLNFQKREIILTLVFPLAYALIKLMEEKNKTQESS